MLAAAALIQGNHWQAAGKQYARARSLYTGDAKGYRAGAECALASNDPTAAIALLDSAIALTPSDPVPLLRLAEIRGTVGDWRGAIAAARQAYAATPDSLRAVRLVQIAAARLGDTAVVDTTFRQALVDHPNDPRLRLAFATILRQRGDTVAERQVELPGLATQ
jgi:tetratricopeptide (TPR) repeat protein